MLKIELSPTAVKNSFHQKQNTLHKTVSTQSSILLFRNVDTTQASQFFSKEEMDKSHQINILSVLWQSKNIKKSLMTLDLSSGLQVPGQI